MSLLGVRVWCWSPPDGTRQAILRCAVGSSRRGGISDGTVSARVRRKEAGDGGTEEAQSPRPRPDDAPVVFVSAEEAAFRRRMVLGVGVGGVIALGANFVGISSQLLALDPQLARRLKLDVLYSVNGFKRCIESSRGFEFVYPDSWVGDQRLLYRAAERAERERSLDLPSLQGTGKARKSVTEPIVAFGPAGSDGELNVSVVVAPVYPGFRLEMLGDAENAGNLILARFLAPQGSGKVATLVNAHKREDQSGHVYYTLEYTVKAASFFRHNLAVYAANNGLLYSLNSQASELAWPALMQSFKEMADSFSLLV